MGDSQQREVVSIFKQVNGSLVGVTKYDTVSNTSLCSDAVA